jgi:hypothetical protein
MRKLRYFQIPGMNVGEVLDEFNERRGEFRVAEADIINVQVLPSTGRKIGTAKGIEEAKVEVLIFYWSEE